jgi:magnesium-transporting ATPase (P-type)
MISKDNLKREVKVYNKITQAKDTYRIIDEFPFDGDRKRMSIILKNLKDKQVIMMSKGADMSMIDRIDFAKNDFEELKLMLEEDIAQYSKEGLRTLVIASKTLTRKEYKLLKRDLKKVSKLNGIEKEIRLAEIQNKYERNLKYIGVTAVEDKL